MKDRDKKEINEAWDQMDDRYPGDETTPIDKLTISYSICTLLSNTETKL